MKRLSALLLTVFFCCLLWATPSYAADTKSRINIVVDSFVNKTGDRELDWLTVGYSDLLKRDLAVVSELNILPDKNSGEKTILVKGEVTGDAQGLKIQASLLDSTNQSIIENISLQGSKEELLNMEKEMSKKVAWAVLALSSAKLSKEEEQKMTKNTSDSLAAVMAYYQLYSKLPDNEKKIQQVELVDRLFNSLPAQGMEYQTGKLETLKLWAEDQKVDAKITYAFRVKPEFVQNFIQTLQPFSLERSYKYGFIIENPLLGKTETIYLCKDAQDRAFLYRKKLKLVLILKGENGEVLKEVEARPLIAPPVNTFGKLFSTDKFITGEYIFSGLELDLLNRIKEVNMQLVN